MASVLRELEAARVVAALHRAARLAWRVREAGAVSEEEVVVGVEVAPAARPERAAQEREVGVAWAV